MGGFANTYEMAMVVAFSVVVTQPFHRIVFGDVLREFTHEFLRAVPNCGNSFNVFVQADDEAVFLLVVCHELEWIVFDIAEDFDAGLDPPVPLIIHHERLPVEKA